MHASVCLIEAILPAIKIQFGKLPKMSKKMPYPSKEIPEVENVLHLQFKVEADAFSLI